MPRRKSERERFEELALSQADALYRFAFYLCRDEIDAEDLTQETYLSAFQKAHQFRAGTNLKAWLFRIARNSYIDRLRRKKKEPELAEMKDTPEKAMEKHPGFARWKSLGIEDKQNYFEVFGDEVNRFLNEMPADFRLALVLCDVEGLSYLEISQVVSCPVGTIRSRISRARSQLREKLHGYAKELGYFRESKA